MLEPLSTEKTAAPSVQATIEPRSMPWSAQVEQPRRGQARMAAVAAVPSVASDRLGPITGRISGQPGGQPALEQDESQGDDADGARRSWSSSEWPKSTRPSPSDPIAIPRPRKSTRPGTRRRPATSVAAIPSASKAPPGE